MKKIQVALLGLGTVGKGVYQNLTVHRKRIEEKLGISIDIAVIVVKHPEKHQAFEANALITSDFQTVLDNPSIDIVLEAIVGKEPAFTYLSQSIQAGKHVITANKEMFAHHGKQLLALANANKVEIGFEATTAGGIPIIQTLNQLFQVNGITKLTGILNGTSNYVLTEMRLRQLTFEQALHQAQQLGYAEADPSNDIDGHDAFYKLMILSQVMFNTQPEWSQVERTGISSVTLNQVVRHQAKQERIKLLATVEMINGAPQAKVAPEVLTADHPLYTIDGAYNGIFLEGDIVGTLTLSGLGAGAHPTASAMLEDLAIILRHGEATKRPYLVSTTSR
ncbi:homoserine dehydrogenase [Ornithinibacillus contaminans]|uniref:homoserine dehydrogenase n=1 Tax=Ornithinibacillus contaminans TaxID=694055 RepID=UPI00064D9ABC|nr:homoserine dehydrogenase [Ornithinibacillus contaminans]